MSERMIYGLVYDGNELAADFVGSQRKADELIKLFEQTERFKVKLVSKTEYQKAIVEAERKELERIHGPGEDD